MKDISLRLKSIKNIQKITKSMKMVSAAKYARAERELKPARAYGAGANGKLGGSGFHHTVVTFNLKQAEMAHNESRSTIYFMEQIGAGTQVYSFIAGRLRADKAQSSLIDFLVEPP